MRMTSCSFVGMSHSSSLLVRTLELFLPACYLPCVCLLCEVFHACYVVLSCTRYDQPAHNQTQAGRAQGLVECSARGFAAQAQSAGAKAAVAGLTGGAFLSFVTITIAEYMLSFQKLCVCPDDLPAMSSAIKSRGFLWILVSGLETCYYYY